MTIPEILTEVNEKWKRAEAQLKEINPISSVEITWTTENGEWKLSWYKGQICVLSPSTSQYKPILESSANVRVGCMAQFLRLKKLLVKSTGETLFQLQNALAEFESALENGDA